MADIDAVLNERQKSHGDYKDHAKITQDLKDVLRGSLKWSELDDMQRETLEMLAHKIGRILSGDPNFLDHWVDICGYTQLIVRDLERINAYIASGQNPIRRPGEHNPETPSLVQASCVWPIQEEEL